jgi:TldD protein
MLERGLVDKILRRAISGGGDFSEIFVESRRNFGIAVDTSRVQRVSSGLDRGAGIRVVRGTVVSYVYSEDLDEAALLRAAETAATVGRHGGGAFALGELDGRARRPQRVEVEPQSVDAGAKIELLMEADQAARAVSSRIKQVNLGYSDSVQEVLVASSGGLWAEDRRVRVGLAASAIAHGNGEIQTGSEAPRAMRGFEFFDDVSAAHYARVAAQRAVLLLDAAPAPAGLMPVVVGNEFGGVLFHEASGHGLEADFVAKKSTVFAGRLGQQVASPLVTAIDDGTLDWRWGTLAIDDEGMPTRKTTLIENGVLVSYLYDRLRAGQQAHAVTGNGRRESYQHLPMPRMTNTYIAAGSSTPEEIIAATKQGLYAKKLGSGQVDVTSGDFVFAVTEGYLIEDGRIGPPVRGATITGNGPKSLLRIDMVGNDLGLSAGTCGKSGQSVPVSVGQPTLRIAELLVGGTRSALRPGQMRE